MPMKRHRLCTLEATNMRATRVDCTILQTCKNRQAVLRCPGPTHEASASTISGHRGEEHLLLHYEIMEDEKSEIIDGIGNMPPRTVQSNPSRI